MPSKQSESVRRRWEASWLAMTQPSYLAHVIGSPDDWQMTPTLANGQPAAIASYRGSAFGLGVLTVTPTGITAITVFAGGPEMAARFGLTPPGRRA